MAVFYKGDTLKLIKDKIKDKSINLIYIDPPFGTTQNDWDEKQNWSLLFKEFFRILKDDGMIVIHCSVPFNYELIRTAPKPPLYSWYWDKKCSTCPLLANKQPMRRMEEILVWKNKKTTYYRQQIGTEIRETASVAISDYYKKNLEPRYKKTMVGKTRNNLLEFPREIEGGSTRPKELIKLMIDSYSKQGDTILDCYCHQGISFTQSAGRKWIGMDKYFLPSHLIR